MQSCSSCAACDACTYDHDVQHQVQLLCAVGANAQRHRRSCRLGFPVLSSADPCVAADLVPAQRIIPCSNSRQPHSPTDPPALSQPSARTDIQLRMQHCIGARPLAAAPRALSARIGLSIPKPAQAVHVCTSAQPKLGLRCVHAQHARACGVVSLQSSNWHVHAQDVRAHCALVLCRQAVPVAAKRSVAVASAAVSAPTAEPTESAKFASEFTATALFCYLSCTVRRLQLSGRCFLKPEAQACCLQAFATASQMAAGNALHSTLMVITSHFAFLPIILYAAAIKSVLDSCLLTFKLLL